MDALRTEYKNKLGQSGKLDPAQKATVKAKPRKDYCTKKVT